MSLHSLRGVTRRSPKRPAEGAPFAIFVRFRTTIAQSPGHMSLAQSCTHPCEASRSVMRATTTSASDAEKPETCIGFTKTGGPTSGVILACRVAQRVTTSTFRISLQSKPKRSPRYQPRNPAGWFQPSTPLAESRRANSAVRKLQEIERTAGPAMSAIAPTTGAGMIERGSGRPMRANHRTRPIRNRLALAATIHGHLRTESTTSSPGVIPTNVLSDGSTGALLKRSAEGALWASAAGCGCACPTDSARHERVDLQGILSRRSPSLSSHPCCGVAAQRPAISPGAR